VETAAGIADAEEAVAETVVEETAAEHEPVETVVEIVAAVIAAAAAAGVWGIVAAVSGRWGTVAASACGGMAVVFVSDEGAIDAAGLWEIAEVEKWEVVASATWRSAALERKPDAGVARGVGGG
jgi:hypothetical protein